MNSEDDFKKWQYSFRIQMKQYQPFFHNFDKKPDPVKLELERLDRLENVVNMRDTKWVEDYCKSLTADDSK